MIASLIAGLIIGFIIGFYLRPKRSRADANLTAKKPRADITDVSLGTTRALNHAVAGTSANTAPPNTQIDSPSFDATDAKEQAKQFVQQHKIDAMLLKVFEEIRHYGTWSKREDFAKWNIGVSDVKSEKHKTKIAYYDIELEFLSFAFSGRRVTFAFGDHRGYTPDGGWTETDIVFLLDDAIVVTLRYDKEYSEYGSDLGFSGVEELHKDEAAFDLLEKLCKLVDQKHAEAARQRKEEENKAYQGKFTL